MEVRQTASSANAFKTEENIKRERTSTIFLQGAVTRGHTTSDHDLILEG
jgi:hypothetical protein